MEHGQSQFDVTIVTSALKYLLATCATRAGLVADSLRCGELLQLQIQEESLPALCLTPHKALDRVLAVDTVPCSQPGTLPTASSAPVTIDQNECDFCGEC